MGENFDLLAGNKNINDTGLENKHRSDALDSASPTAKKLKTNEVHIVKDELSGKDPDLLNDRTKDTGEDAENKNDQGINNLTASELNSSEADEKTHCGHNLIIDSDTGNKQWQENGNLVANEHIPNNKSDLTQVAREITIVEADAAEDKGSRHTMEDAWVVLSDATLGITGNLRCAHFAIYDGHGGRQAADYARAHLHSNVLSAGLPRELVGLTGLMS